MVIRPHGKVIFGRVLDFVVSDGGLELPSERVTNVTVFMVVDLVGPDVTKCKPGDVILYLKGNHIYTRDNWHRLVATDDDVLLTLELTPEELGRCAIEGKRVKAAECPVCKLPTTNLLEGAIAMHEACAAEVQAAEEYTAACPHPRVNEHGICARCGGLRGDDGTFEAPIRRPTSVFAEIGTALVAGPS